MHQEGAAGGRISPDDADTISTTGMRDDALVPVFCALGTISTPTISTRKSIFYRQIVPGF